MAAGPTGGGGGVSLAVGDGRWLRIDAAQGNTAAEMEQALENAGLSLNTDEDAFEIDSGIVVDAEIPIQDATP